MGSRTGTWLDPAIRILKYVIVRPDANTRTLRPLPNVAAHFKRMQERPSVKKLLAYEKEVNEGFAKTA